MFKKVAVAVRGSLPVVIFLGDLKNVNGFFYCHCLSLFFIDLWGSIDHTGLAACSRHWLVNISVQLVVLPKSFGFQRVNMCLPKGVEEKHGRSGYSV
jgi:hypothetical protein